MQPETHNLKQWRTKNRRLKASTLWRLNTGNGWKIEQAILHLTATLGCLRITVTTATVLWVAGPAIEMETFGAAAEVLRDTADAKNRQKPDGS